MSDQSICFESTATESRLRIAARGLLRAINSYDHGWPHPESEIHEAMKEVRDALA